MPKPWRPALVIQPAKPTALLLDTLSIPAKACWWVSERLRYAYAGQAIRIRRASDNAQLDIPFLTASTNKLDEAAIIAHCGAGTTNGFVRVIYDQSGGGFDYTQATAGQQPKIFDTVTLIQKIGSSAAYLSDGSNDGFTATNALGLSGTAVALSYWSRIAPSAVAGFQAVMSLGPYALDDGLSFYYGATDTVIFADVVAGSRSFTASSLTAAPSNLLLTLGAGAAISTAVVQQNGVALTQLAVVNGTSTLDLSNTERGLCKDATTPPITGKQIGGITWNGVVSASDIDKLNAHFW